MTQVTNDGQTPKRGPGRPSNAEKAAMQAAREDRAINHPVNTGNNTDFEAGEYIPDFDDVVDYTHMKFTLVAPQIVAVGEREFADVVEQEKFMQDRLVIVIHKSPDKNAPPRVPVGLNGDICWLPRDRKIRLPRGLVGNLLQSQERTFATKRNPDPNADEGMVTTQENTPAYPINILYDPNPRKGAAWARRVVAQGC